MLLAVDKPAWITSFDVIRIFRRHFPKQKIGHSGTLDPMATGLIILALGEDTKQLYTLLGLDKSYIATIDFSKITDTRDMEIWEQITNYDLDIRDGKVCGLTMGHGNIPLPSLSDITHYLDTLIPECVLPIPPFSAKKRAGKKSYTDARAGNLIEESRLMKIHGYEIISYEFPLLQLSLNVWSGTYIRSIAHRLGAQLWLWGTLIQLRRTAIGSYHIDQLPNRETLHNVYKDQHETLMFTRL